MPRTRLEHVTIPEEFEDAFKVAEDTVKKYFQQETRNPERGTIEVDEERYFLVRAESISLDFFRTLHNLYPTVDAEVRQSLGHNLLFELAFNLGQSDAQHFHESMEVNDPIQRLSTGPVHFAYTGWARVNILEDSNPTPDKDYRLHYVHPNSHEAESWVRSGEEAREPICYMNAGYSSGWCTESFDIDVVSVEVQCRATGDDQCEFIMAHSDHIQDAINEYDRDTSESINRRIPTLPDFVETRNLARTVRDQEEQIETLARLHEENPNPVLRFSPEGELLYLNDAARNHWEDLSLEEGLTIEEPFDEWVRTAWENQETIKREYNHGDRWYQLEVVPVGELGYINAYAVEITERKQAEENLEQSLQEKQLLIEELHHRIKNNLQMASSLLDLQARSLDDETASNALKQSKNRLKTMSMIHEKLSRSERGDYIKLDRYLKEITKDIVRMYDSREDVSLEYELDSATVKSQIAVPCGLIMNELATNALEHGLKREGDGILKIILNNDNGNHFTLTLADNGTQDIDETDLKNPDSLGLSIVTSLIEDHLNGDLELECNEWTRFSIRFQV